MSAGSVPTVLLVHGAFTDASSWALVVERLIAENLDVRAIVNPLRGLVHDGEYVASIAEQVDGPVVLVGHSYAGAVISYAGARADNVEGLVFVAAVGLERGESMGDSVAVFPDLGLNDALVPQQYGETDPELYLAADKYGDIFAADLPESAVTVAAVSQRPAASAAFTQPMPIEPGWKSLPNWFVVATEDRALHPDAQRMFAERLGARIVAIDASHSVASSQPDEVARIIATATWSLASEVPVSSST